MFYTRTLQSVYGSNTLKDIVEKMPSSNERSRGKRSWRKALKEESQEEQRQAELSLPTSAAFRSKV